MPGELRVSAKRRRDMAGDRSRYPFTRLVLRFSLDHEAYTDFKENGKLPRDFEAPSNVADWEQVLIDADWQAINALISHEYLEEAERQGDGGGVICLTHIGKGWPGGPRKRET
jgi:hypothetical protein